MRIAVIGGTGVVGRHVVDEAKRRGHDTVSLSRSSGVDVVTRVGLDDALRGVAAVVDVSNVVTMRRATALSFFESSAKHVQAAALAAGVEHLVVLSIVGIDQLRSFGYYDAKLTHERLHLDGPVPATVLRATQFHEFAGQLLARAAAGPVALIPALLVQTVAARSVAGLLVDAAEGAPSRGRLADVAGPGPPASLPDLARAVLARSGSRAKALGVPVPGAAGRAVRAGALLAPADANLVAPSFEQWLDGPDGPAAEVSG